MRHIRRCRRAASEIVTGAERAGHHLELDVRCRDWLHVALTTHVIVALTNLDVDVAG